MPHLKCSSCDADLYTAARSQDLIDPRCPTCGAAPGRVGPTHVAPIRRASTSHQRIADRFGEFVESGRA
jgi:hypothetical protein